MKRIAAISLSIILVFLTLTSSVIMTSATQAFGDVDNDGSVNSSDALMILQVSVGKTEITDEILLYGDVDADGIINSSDALLILQKTVGVHIGVSDFSLNLTEKTVSVGQTVQLEAFGFKPKVSDNTKIEWMSSDNSIATVDENGLVKTLKPGKVTVTAKSVDVPEIQKQASITVRSFG